MRSALLAIVLILVGCDAGERTPTGPRPDQLALREIVEYTARAQREIDSVAKAVLERYAADHDSVPDSGLLQHETTILVDRDLAYDGTGGTLTADALPRGAFALRSPSEMQTDADRTDKYVHYIFIHDLHIEGDRATFWVGVHLKLPNHPEGPGTCCCSAEQLYVKRNGAWTYAETTSSICS
ncbi:MAG TPA: hypothetical protein VMZ53_22935 [Kofleriaceae bacterium]|nr:hypothetical protein [Kofleriaceae bacterium]